MLGRFLLLVFPLLTSCTTVQVPLGGVHINRPHAGGSEFGARIGVGRTDVPTVQGTVDELLGPDGAGDIVNPIPGDSPLYPESFPLPTYDLALTFAKRFDVGVSASRGYYGMVDVFQGEDWAFTFTPSYYATSVGKVKSTDENGMETDLTTVSADIRNINLTALASKWWGDDDGVAFYVYGGLGLNQYTLKIDDRRTGDSVEGKKAAPTVLAGIHGKLVILELNIEAASTRLEQRDGTVQNVTNFSSLITFRLDSW